MSEAKKTILIVEDQAAAAEMFSEMLKLSGYAVITCASGQSAIEALAMETVDAVVLDMMMPGISGMEVLAHIREGGDLPVIVVSAKGLPSDIKAGMDAGASQYLTKPVSYSDLKKAVEDVLAG